MHVGFAGGAIRCFALKPIGLARHERVCSQLVDLQLLQCWIRWLAFWCRRWVAWMDVVAAASRCPLMGMYASLVFDRYFATLLYSYILLYRYYGSVF